MNLSPKEKRTKEDVLRLLDRAMEQEENQAKKIRMLEEELSVCRKKAENPRAELNETTLPASKTAFRIDYYLAAANSPIKGIIEHLPTRDTLSFIGEGFDEISIFVSQYLPGNKPSTSLQKKKKSETAIQSVVQPDRESPGNVKKEISPLLRRLLPDFFPAVKHEATEVALMAPPSPIRKHSGTFSIIDADNQEQTGIVQKSEPFQLLIPLDELAEFLHKPCFLRLSVERLEGGQPFILSENVVPDSQKIRVPQKTMRLPEAGAYRITASLTMAEGRGNYYQESRLIVVR